MGDERSYQPSVGQSGPQGQPDNRSEQLKQQSLTYWTEIVRENPIQRLRYLDARMAAGAQIDKDRVAELVRDAGAAAVLADPDAVGLVRQLFGERGVQRLRDRARTETERISQ